MFVAIDGHGGSGKSTLADLLGETLQASIIHIDDFAGIDSPPGWWSNVIAQVFEPVSAGAESIAYQPESWGEDHHPQAVTLPVTPIMILEGVSSSRSKFADFIGFRVFVDTPKEICLERGIERDTGAGLREEDVERMWAEWFAEEEEYMRRDNPKAKADIILDGTKLFIKQIVGE
ncbi:MAG: hypothetical protein AAF583_03850 [Pseudomonadota bacterium]